MKKQYIKPGLEDILVVKGAPCFSGDGNVSSCSIGTSADPGPCEIGMGAGHEDINDTTAGCFAGQSAANWCNPGQSALYCQGGGGPVN